MVDKHDVLAAVSLLLCHEGMPSLQVGGSLGEDSKNFIY